jgi:uncharacterized protein with GYD domain
VVVSSSFRTGGLRRKCTMPTYLVSANYTKEGIEGLRAKGGSARKAAVQRSTESVGGRLIDLYFAFGGTDVYCVVELPDNEAAAALALAVAATGTIRCNTTVLLTPEEMDTAVLRDVSFQPPGG